jgi:hypothetical protein
MRRFDRIFEANTMSFVGDLLREAGQGGDPRAAAPPRGV